MKNMFHKKNKTNNNKQMELHQQQHIIIEKKQLSLIDKTENK